MLDSSVTAQFSASVSPHPATVASWAYVLRLHLAEDLCDTWHRVKCTLDWRRLTVPLWHSGCHFNLNFKFP